MDVSRNDQNLLTQPHLGMGHSLGMEVAKIIQNLWIQGQSKDHAPAAVLTPFHALSDVVGTDLGFDG